MHAVLQESFCATISALYRIRIALVKQEDFREREGKGENQHEPIGTVYVAGELSLEAVQIGRDLGIIHPIHENFVPAFTVSKFKFTNGMVFILVFGQHPSAFITSGGLPDRKRKQDADYTLLTAVVLCDFGKKTTLNELSSQLLAQLETVDIAEVERAQLQFTRRQDIANDFSILSEKNVAASDVFAYPFVIEHVYQIKKQMVQTNWALFPSRVCKHHILPSFCAHCSGGSFCDHEIKRTVCALCGGGSLCTHGKQRSQCKQCGRAPLRKSCEHGHQPSQCKQCGRAPKSCEHGHQPSQCKQCGRARKACEHGRIRSQCKDCGGASVCEHGRLRSP